MIKLKIKNQLLIPFLGLTILSTVVNVDAALGLTFEETRKGVLTFYDAQNDQIGGGSFRYSSNPIEGNFIQSALDTFFVEDINELDDLDIYDISIDRIITITSEDNFHLITDINAWIGGAKLNPIVGTVSPRGFSNIVLLFQPTANEFFIPNMDSVLTIATGDPRAAGLYSSSEWLLTDTSFIPFANQRIFLSDDGKLSGFIFDTRIQDSNIQGTWTAQAVPEPLTILGGVTAIAFASGFKHKLIKAKKK